MSTSAASISHCGNIASKHSSGVSHVLIVGQGGVGGWLLVKPYVAALGSRARKKSRSCRQSDRDIRGEEPLVVAACSSESDAALDAVHGDRQFGGPEGEMGSDVLTHTVEPLPYLLVHDDQPCLRSAREFSARRGARWI